MVTLEQVKLLETRVTQAIEYVKRVTEENTFLKGKMDSCQKRVDELEALIQQFKEEQSQIESGILSALDRLNHFEDAVGAKPPEESKSPAKSRASEVPDGDTETDSGAENENFSDNGELDIF
jgi:FtsZ-binding cell division protein ZapB